jgi:hypothetical protein
VSEGGWADEANGRSNADDVYTDDIVGWDFAENDNNPSTTASKTPATARTPPASSARG